MKILIFANSMGGLVSFRSELIRELLKTNAVCVVAPYDERQESLARLGCEAINVPVDRRGINPVRDLALFKKFFLFLRREKPELVITYTIKPNIYGGMACRLLRIPYAANITGLGSAFEKNGLLKAAVKTMYKCALRSAAVVFFENTSDRDVFVRERIIPYQKSAVLNGAGVNLDKYSVLPYPEDEPPFRFLFMGRVMREKGVDELLAAARRLHSEGYPLRLDMLGRYEEDYEERLGELEGEGWLFFHGFQSNVIPYIENAHCFVLPSWHEGMANTNLECAASGRPIITSDIPGCREAVIDGVSGLLCVPRDSESLYRSMKEMMETTAARRKEMGAAGRDHMEAVFDKEKVVENTVKLLPMR